jgi:hypothetical protein
MAADPLRPVTTTEIEAFDRDGAVLVKGILPPEWVDRARSGLDAAMSLHDPIPPSSNHLERR